MTETAHAAAVPPDGPTLFARFAFPPNQLGYCGPDDHGALLEYAATGEVDGGLRQLAQGFEGAWPYLELIAGSNRIDDPLDRRVVDAYWIGNDLLEHVPLLDVGLSVTDRFRGRAGRLWEQLAAAVTPEARLCHAFHVFAVYPWVGLLRSGSVEQPLHVLDRCRIRWGQVVEATGDRVLVRTRPLTWEATTMTIGLGEPTIEEVTASRDGLGLVHDLEVGEWVALHWDWVCDRLSPSRLARLRHYHDVALGGVNTTEAAARLPWEEH